MNNYQYLELSDDGKTLIRCNKNAEGKVVIPDGVVVIGESAFHKCINLTSVDIPSSVTYIGEYAFLRHKKPIDFSSAFFGLNPSKITLYVPIGSGYDYRHHPYYSKFAKVMIEE